MGVAAETVGVAVLEGEVAVLRVRAVEAEGEVRVQQLHVVLVVLVDVDAGEEVQFFLEQDLDRRVDLLVFLV